MAIGKRIRFFRNRKGMTQKQLGEILGFLGKTSDVRMAQYETEARTPKHDLVKEMANIFDVSIHALTVPDIDTYIGLMHTLFALEDMYGLKIGEIDVEICLRPSCSTKMWRAVNKVLSDTKNAVPLLLPHCTGTIAEYNVLFSSTGNFIAIIVLFNFEIQCIFLFFGKFY